MKRAARRSRPHLLGCIPAGDEHQVLQLQATGNEYVRTPCPECPWRRANAGNFPPAAFEASANTAHDMAIERFACHMTGADNIRTCAGFLLRNADNNLAIRMAIRCGDIDPSELVDPGASVLFNSYRDMAIENGVDPESPALKDCRSNRE